MPGGGRPKRTLILSQAKRSRAGASRVRLALSTTRRRLSRLINPARSPELGGAVIALDTTAWQGAVRTSQTPAFRMALIAGLSFAWIGTATLSGFADGPTPHPARGQTHTPSDSAVELGQFAGSTVDPDSASDAAPPSPAQVEVSDEFWRNYVKIAAELDRQSGRDEVPVSPQPALPLSHCPTCTDSLLPGPEQSPDAPQATVEEPLAPPPPTAVEEPAPQQPPTNSDQPVSSPTNQPPAEPPPGGPPPADTSG
jgi:hypothetical protein